jgi:hypothetical protein
MKVLWKRGTTPLLLALLVPAGILAQQVPLTNWTVPSYVRSSRGSGALATMTDITPGVAFVGIQPCRVVDTRPSQGFPAGYGAPILAANAIRTFDINSAAHCPGIPAGVEAYSLNFIVTDPSGPSGELRAWPTGNPPPPGQTTSILYWTKTNQTVANATIIPGGTNGQIDVQVVGSNAHLIIDINGYFTDEYDNGNQFFAATTLDGGAAILGFNLSSVTGSHGVGGFVPGPGIVHGVRGEVGPSASEGSSGVHGINQSTTAFGMYGVLGESNTVPYSAGVLGRAGTRVPHFVNCCAAAGVRGESRIRAGVLGVSEIGGVVGKVQKPDAYSAEGILGYAVEEPAVYGVYSLGDAHVAGTFTATTKMFVQPHPTDPSKEIRYVSLEGPHSEIYFRGTAQISQGVARIPIPEHFRFVAVPDSYSTLVTPLGGMATVAVLSEGEDGIVIQASRNVKIHYVVYAEREAVRNPDPIVENIHFRPDPDGKLLAHIPDSYRQLMIRNGTLNPDGTVNMKTASQLGWDKIWEKRSGRPSPTPAPE